MKISTLSAAVTGILMAAGLAGVVANAATATLQPRQPDAAKAHVQPPTDRLIIKYRAQPVVAGDVSAKLVSARAAVTRAGLKQVTTAGARSAALDVSHARRLGAGADLLRLSRKLSSTELEALLVELRADPSVQYAEPSQRRWAVRDEKIAAADVTPALVPDDPYYAQYQWHLSSATGGIAAPQAWDIATGAGTVVAVLDTGILPEHPDLASGNHLLEGYDFISDSFISRRPTDARVPGALDYGDWNPEPDECYPGSEVSDSSWHGTHVAGTVGELTDNGIGMAGVAHDAQILPVRVLGRCGGTTEDVADAILWASGGSVPGVTANTHPAEIISLSLGGEGACSQYEQDAIDQAVANGSLVVVAAGNDNDNAANYAPASCDNVVTIGASRITGGRASYSNYGSSVELSGPGGGGGVDGNPGGYVWQSGYTGLTTPTSGEYDYFGMAGTSMATPHVAAVAALVQSALAEAGKPVLTPAQLSDLLVSTARPFPVAIPAATPIGSGIVDAAAALTEALREPCDPQTEACAPEAVALTNGVAIGNLSGTATSERLYSFTAQAGRTLSILTYGGTGNVSLYVDLDDAPSTTSYLARSVRSGNSETVRFTAPKAGTYYIRLVGAPSYSGVSVQARQ